MLKEVLANDEDYHLVASKLEKHEEFPSKVNPRTIKNYTAELLKQFKKEERIKRNSSGLTEEVGVMNSLLDELLTKKEEHIYSRQ